MRQLIYFDLVVGDVEMELLAFSRASSNNRRVMTHSERR